MKDSKGEYMKELNNNLTTISGGDLIKGIGIAEGVGALYDIGKAAYDKTSNYLEQRRIDAFNREINSPNFKG